MAGSNFFRRTQPDQNGYPAETALFHRDLVVFGKQDLAVLGRFEIEAAGIVNG